MYALNQKNIKIKNVYATMKLDMSKTYDSVDWNFLQAILGKLGFVGPVVELIMR